MVTQLVAQFRGWLRHRQRETSIADVAKSYGSRNAHAQRVRDGFCPVRPGVQDHLPATSPGDGHRFRRRQRVDMSDALAMDTLKALKASDQVVGQTLQASQIIEDEAAQAAPGSAAYLTAPA